MSVVFETFVLVSAILAFFYAATEAHHIHQAIREQTDVWAWVRNTTLLAGTVPFVHLLFVVCHSNICPVLQPILLQVELLLVLTVMIFTVITVYRLKRAVNTERYPL